MKQPSWCYNTVILFAFGGWFAIFQKQIEKILMMNDYIYMVFAVILAVAYCFSFQNRIKCIEWYSVWGGVFTLSIIVFDYFTGKLDAAVKKKLVAIPRKID